MFVPARRDVRPAESPAAVYRDLIWVGTNLRLKIGIDLANKTAVAYVLTKGPDGNNVVGVRDGAAGAKPKAIFPLPVLLLASVVLPIAVLPEPVVLLISAL